MLFNLYVAITLNGLISIMLEFQTSARKEVVVGKEIIVLSYNLVKK